MFRLWLSFIVVLLLGKNNTLGEEVGIQNHVGFGYELIQVQLACLESRFSERYDQLEKKLERVELAQQLNENVDRKITQLEKVIETSIENKVSPISEQISSLLNNFPELFKQLKMQEKRVEVGQQQLNDNVEQKITQLEKDLKNSIGNKLFLISDKISNHSNSFAQLFEHLKKQEKRVEIDHQQLNVNLERKTTQLEKGIETSIGNKVSLISDAISNLSNSFSERYDRLEKQLEQFNDNVERKTTQLEKRIQVSHENEVSQMTDQISKLQNRLLEPICRDLPKAKSGSCSMVIGGNKTVVYQVHRFDVDWLTVLQRSDGSEDFHRNWTDYRDGFGTAGQEFWLGFERLHVLTKNDSYELAFELEDFAGNYKYARYDNFSIGPEEDLYRLNVLGKYSGTAGDSLTGHKGHQFTTLDKGPDQSCANSWTGGWWYFKCYYSHLTGLWQRTNEWSSIVWWSFEPQEKTPLKFARMLIRKI